MASRLVAEHFVAVQHDEQFCAHDGCISTSRNFFNFNPNSGARHEHHGFGEHAEGPLAVRLSQSRNVVYGPVLQFASGAAVDDAVLEINLPVIVGRRNYAISVRSRDETVADRDGHEGALDADIDHVLQAVAGFSR